MSGGSFFLLGSLLGKHVPQPAIDPRQIQKLGQIFIMVSQCETQAGFDIVFSGGPNSRYRGFQDTL